MQFKNEYLPIVVSSARFIGGAFAVLGSQQKIRL